LIRLNSVSFDHLPPIN